MLRSVSVGMLLMAAVACGDASTAPSNRTDAAVSNHAGAGSTMATADVHKRALATSSSHTCALRKAGVFCWGANDKGQLGDKSSTSSDKPVQASVAGSDVVEVALHTGRTCVRKQSGKVACWGANDSGQLGDGTRNDSIAAVEPKVDNVKQLALDEKSSCALRADGSVWCWGAAPEAMQDQGSLEPTAIEGIADASDLHSGAMNTYCARNESRETKCWHIQNGTWSPPTEASALSGASVIALASAQEVCGIIQTTGAIVCQDLAGGASVPLPGSRGTSQLAGGLLTLCGGDNAGAWGCWSILSPAVLQAIGAPRRELSRGPFFELATAGYRYCGLEAGGQVQCMESNVQPMQFSAVADLPD